MTAGADPLTGSPVPDWFEGVSPAEAARRRSTDPALLDLLAGPDNDLQVRLAVANNPSSGSGTLERLAGDPLSPLAMSAVANPAFPPARLAGIAGDFTLDGQTLAAAARNPSTPPSGLARLAGHPNNEIARKAARNPNCPEGTLIGLTRSPDPQMQTAVALNPAASPEILTMLAADGSSYVRTLVAMHPATPPEQLAALAADPHGPTRRAAAANPGTPAAGKAAAGLLAD